MASTEQVEKQMVHDTKLWHRSLSKYLLAKLRMGTITLLTILSFALPVDVEAITPPTQRYLNDIITLVHTSQFALMPVKRQVQVVVPKIDSLFVMVENDVFKEIENKEFTKAENDLKKVDHRMASVGFPRHGDCEKLLAKVEEARKADEQRRIEEKKAIRKEITPSTARVSFQVVDGKKYLVFTLLGKIERNMEHVAGHRLASAFNYIKDNKYPHIRRVKAFKLPGGTNNLMILQFTYVWQI